MTIGMRFHRHDATTQRDSTSAAQYVSHTWRRERRCGSFYFTPHRGRPVRGIAYPPGCSPRFRRLLAVPCGHKAVRRAFKAGLSAHCSPSCERGFDVGQVRRDARFHQVGMQPVPHERITGGVHRFVALLCASVTFQCRRRNGINQLLLTSRGIASHCRFRSLSPSVASLFLHSASDNGRWYASNRSFA